MEASKIVGALTGELKSEAPPQRPRQAFDGRSVLELLFAKAEGRLSRRELEFLSDASQYAQSLAQKAADVATGIGCLIDTDGEHAARGNVSAGNFQSSHDVPTLLFHFAEVFTHIEGLASIGSQADYKLRAPDAAIRRGVA